MKIYAMSDIHGCYDAFLDALDLVDLSGDNKLILLGDYIHGRDSEESFMVLDKIRELESKYGEDKVIVLMGNHERFVIDEGESIGATKANAEPNDRDGDYLSWLADLRRYYETENQIFVHAGIDETGGEYWENTTDEIDFTDLYLVEPGKSFYKDVVSGHVYTHEIAGDQNFFGIYYDGASHYYIDGDTLTSGRVPVLMYDTETETYYDAESGEEITPYE